MRNIINYVISFIISILTIFATLFTNPDVFLIWLLWVIIILLSPLVLYKLCKDTLVSKTQKVIFVQILVLLVTLIFAWKNICPSNDDYLVAVTTSLNKANDIQNFLTTVDRSTKLEIFPEEKNHPKSYAVSVKKLSPKRNRLVSHELLNSDIFDGSFVLNPSNVKFTNNRIKMLKRLKKESEQILYGIDGITWLELKIVPPDNINSDNAKIKSITVRYETQENVDSQKIRKKVEDFINSLFANSPNEVIIEDLKLNHKAYLLIEQAQKEFEKNNYSKATELVKEANKLNSHYSSDINTIPKFIELDQKIKKDTQNYKNCIQLGDLLSSEIFVTSVYANLEAIKNYKKALEINPNAYEVYEKIARNYRYLNMGYSILSDFAPDAHLKKIAQECDKKSFEYSLKVIEHSLGNSRIYQSLGYYYYRNGDYKKALEYYNKIDTTDGYCKTECSNKKVYANFKTGRYIDAWKETKNCSMWYCKLVRFNFTSDEI